MPPRKHKEALECVCRVHEFREFMYSDYEESGFWVARITTVDDRTGWIEGYIGCCGSCDPALIPFADMQTIGNALMFHNSTDVVSLCRMKDRLRMTPYSQGHFSLVLGWMNEIKEKSGVD